MKIEWLETIMAVALHGSFGKAAEVIPCDQSYVSRQVKSAETELGFEIFDRALSNKTALTENGMRIMPFISRTACRSVTPPLYRLPP